MKKIDSSLFVGVLQLVSSTISFSQHAIRQQTREKSILRQTQILQEKLLGQWVIVNYYEDNSGRYDKIYINSSGIKERLERVKTDNKPRVPTQQCPLCTGDGYQQCSRCFGKTKNIKTRIFLTLLWFFASFQPVFAQLTEAKLVGTWHLSAITSLDWGNYATTKDYIFYADRRYYTLRNTGLPDNGGWKIEGNTLILNSDYFGTESYQISASQLSFDYQFSNLSENLKYKAKKIADSQRRLYQKDILGNIKHFPESSSNTIDFTSLCGTWRAKNLNTNTTFFFTIYPDYRWVNSNSANGTLVLDGNESYWYVDYEDRPTTIATNTFSTTHWSYRSLEKGHSYVAEKISTKPQPILSPSPQLVPGDRKCHCCLGKGRYACAGCDGRKGQYVSEWNGTRYENRWHNCSVCVGSGDSLCSCCGGVGKK